MAGTWAEVTPLALGAAVSPMLLATQLLIISGRVQPLRRAWAFTGGIALTSIVYVFVLATVARGLDLPDGPQSLTERIVKGIAALALIILGIRALRHQPDPQKQARRRQRLRGAPLMDFVGVGFGIMWTNLSSLVLILPAVHIAVTAQSPAPETFALLAFIVLCATLPALVPALLATVAGSKADAPLKALSGFTQRHSSAVNAGICYLFAVLLIISAIQA